MNPLDGYKANTNGNPHSIIFPPLIAVRGCCSCSRSSTHWRGCGYWSLEVHVSSNLLICAISAKVKCAGKGDSAERGASAPHLTQVRCKVSLLF